MPASKNYKRFAELIRLFPARKVLVVGDVMLDRYVEGTVRRISPEAPAPVLEDTVERCATGGAGNVAKNLARLGAKAVLMGVVGIEEYSKKFFAAAEEEGYDPSFVRQDPEYTTTVKTRYVSGPQLLLRHDQNNRQPLRREAEDELIRNLPAAMADADGVILSDYAKQTLTERLVGAVKQAARQRRVHILADAKPANAKWFKGVDMLSPNADEARAFLGLRSGEGRLQDIAYDVRAKYSAGIVFLTAGDQGMWVSYQGNNHELIAQHHKIELKDTSGCGDTVSAVILLAMLCGAEPLEAAELANAAGAVVASKRGAVAPTPQEVLATLRS